MCFLPISIFIVNEVFLEMFQYSFFYNFHKIKWYDEQLIIINVHLFSPFSVCMSALKRCPPLCFLFVLLNCNCSLSAAHFVYFYFCQFLLVARQQQLPSFEPRIFTFLQEEKIRWQIEECRDEDKGLQEWRIRNGLSKNTPFVHMLYCFPVLCMQI